MQFMQLSLEDREATLAELASMPRFLEEHFVSLSAEEAQRRGAGDSFSPVEHCWHLADLEREGFARRIQRLRTEDAPALDDFDGARVAEQRNYRALPLAAGIESFRQARAATLLALRSIADHEWSRDGMQEGYGPITLCDMPAMMAGHDTAHRQEIEAWTNRNAEIPEG